jgi:hypothetical protein
MAEMENSVKTAWFPTAGNPDPFSRSQVKTTKITKLVQGKGDNQGCMFSDCKAKFEREFQFDFNGNNF